VAALLVLAETALMYNLITTSPVQTTLSVLGWTVPVGVVLVMLARTAETARSHRDQLHQELRDEMHESLDAFGNVMFRAVNLQQEEAAAALDAAAVVRSRYDQRCAERAAQHPQRRSRTGSGTVHGKGRPDTME